MLPRPVAVASARPARPARHFTDEKALLRLHTEAVETARATDCCRKQELFFPA